MGWETCGNYTSNIYPPKKKDGLQEHRMIKTKQGGDAEPPAHLYLSGLEVTLNNTTIYRRDLKERDGDESLPSTVGLSVPDAASSIYDINTQAAPAGRNSSLQMCDRLALSFVSGVENIWQKICRNIWPREGAKLGREVLLFVLLFYTVTEETAEPLHPNLL